MEKHVDLCEKRKWLLAALKHLRGIKQMRPTWGRLYANTLVKLVLVEMKLEQLEQQKGCEPR
ncbi:hypothetical protein EDM54_17210 [Brevibacillus borstelensis]|nr:hypothetical protein [Brevibacillus borstelensis]MED1885466.1 hypothetical protein [Brevibacillus borstelensis]NOU53822.1 hypothetical protein [Brevibacillus borstelensis]RNB61521.1 hypothetical protein EDM54_17210 [Brevibacillus borstelensis]GED55793.1 hypothetical protein BBO01nite_50340 [Brevibacillus borstelensis]